MRRSIRRSGWAAWVLLAAVLVVCPLAARRAQAQGGQKWALVVGVDRYDHEEQIHPLRYAGADAVAVRQALVRYGGFAPDHVFLMTSESGQAPSSENILGQLAGLQASVQPGDSFVFFFSGHGAEKGNERFLLTSNTNPAAVFTLEQSALEVRKIRDIIEGLKASRILELVDACANNPWGSDRAAANAKSTAGMARDLELTARRRGGDLDAAVTILSCHPGQRSYEGCHGHGYFSYYLVQGLAGAAASDGVVTVPSLVNYLAKEVPSAVRVNEYGKAQVPDAHTDGTGAFSWRLAVVGGKTAHPHPVAYVPPAPEAAPQAAPPSATPKPALAPPTVKVSFPPAGFVTARSEVVLGALVTGGGRLSDVSVSVNGQDVTLGAKGLRKTVQGAVLKTEVPLEVGDNTIMVTAVAESGAPGQTAVVVRRKAPPYVAGHRPPAEPSKAPVQQKHHPHPGAIAMLPPPRPAVAGERWFCIVFLLHRKAPESERLLFMLEAALPKKDYGIADYCWDDPVQRGGFRDFNVRPDELPAVTFVKTKFQGGDLRYRLLEARHSRKLLHASRLGNRELVEALYRVAPLRR